MAIIKDETLFDLAKYLMWKTIDGDFPQGLTPDMVFTTVRATVQSEKCGSLLCDHLFGGWINVHRDSIQKWSKGGING